MKDKSKSSKEEVLASRVGEPCASGTGRLKAGAIKELRRQLRGKWKLKGTRQLERTFKFDDFKGALRFTNQVGKVAEEQGHHPDVLLTYGAARIQLSTHSAGGLTENDFILAAKINRLK